MCCIVNEDFLHFAKDAGNDLMTAAPHFNFPGLKPGDQWCRLRGDVAGSGRSGQHALLIGGNAPADPRRRALGAARTPRGVIESSLVTTSEGLPVNTSRRRALSRCMASMMSYFTPKDSAKTPRARLSLGRHFPPKPRYNPKIGSRCEGPMGWA